MSETLRLRKDGLTWQKVDGEVVALDVPRSLYLSANSSGAILWEALERGASRDELVRALSGAYSLDEAAARRDVDSFLADLDARGLLSTAGSESP